MPEILNQDSRPQDDQGLTREAGLHQAIKAFRRRFTEIGLSLPGKLHVSVGFGYSSRAESKEPRRDPRRSRILGVSCGPHVWCQSLLLPTVELTARSHRACGACAGSYDSAGRWIW